MAYMFTTVSHRIVRCAHAHALIREQNAVGAIGGVATGADPATFVGVPVQRTTLCVDRMDIATLDNALKGRITRFFLA